MTKMTIALSVALVSTIMISAPITSTRLRSAWLTEAEIAVLISIVSAVSRDISSAEWVCS